MDKPQSSAPAKPGAPAPAVPAQPRTGRPSRPWIPRPEGPDRVESIDCRLPMTREMASLARFWNDVYERAKMAELYIAGNRIKGSEFDAFHERWMNAIGEVLKVGIELGRRADLVSVLQTHRKLLAHFGYQPNGLKFGEDSPKKKSKAAGGKPAKAPMPTGVAAATAAPAPPGLAVAS